MLVRGWLKFSQPHLLTMAAATLQSIDRSGSRARRAGAAPLGVNGGPGGREGRRPGRVQYWRGKEQHCTASRPSRPPGARDPAPHRLKRDQPKDPERSGKLSSPGRPEGLGGRKRGKGTGRGGGGRGRRPKGRHRYPGRPLSDAGVVRACSLNTPTARRGAVAMVTRIPATELKAVAWQLQG